MADRSWPSLAAVTTTDTPVVDLPRGAVSAVVLGIMQDAGLPHAGCRCRRCMAAYEDPGLTQYAASLAIVDARGEAAGVWLIDATPDIRHQLNMLAGVLGPHPAAAERLRQPDGLFLTHAHMGHTAGLAQLGPEGMNVQSLPVYASAALVEILDETRLWRPLTGNLDLRPFETGQPVHLAPDLTVIPLPVPHRDELDSGTFAMRIEGPGRALLYLPDIDSWAQWPEARQILEEVDVALVDASFYSADELGGRPPVAHPLVPDTLAYWKGIRTRLVLTHLNHTNPVLDIGSPAREAVLAGGAEIASNGQRFDL